MLSDGVERGMECEAAGRVRGGVYCSCRIFIDIVEQHNYYIGYSKLFIWLKVRLTCLNCSSGVPMLARGELSGGLLEYYKQTEGALVMLASEHAATIMLVI